MCHTCRHYRLCYENLTDISLILKMAFCLAKLSPLAETPARRQAIDDDHTDVVPTFYLYRKASET